MRKQSTLSRELGEIQRIGVKDEPLGKTERAIGCTFLDDKKRQNFEERTREQESHACRTGGVCMPCKVESGMLFPFFCVNPGVYRAECIKNAWSMLCGAVLRGVLPDLSARPPHIFLNIGD